MPNQAIPGQDAEIARTQISSAEVHKHRAEHVWVTEAEAVEDGMLAIAFEVPDSNDLVRFADLMEVQRQSGIVHVHENCKLRDRMYLY